MFYIFYTLSESNFGFGSHIAAKCIELRRSNRQCRLTTPAFRVKNFRVPSLNTAIPNLSIGLKGLEVTYSASFSESHGAISVTPVKSMTRAAIKSCTVDFWGLDFLDVEAEAEYYCGLMMQTVGNAAEVSEWVNESIVGAYTKAVVASRIRATIIAAVFKDFSKVSGAKITPGSLVVTGDVKTP